MAYLGVSEEQLDFANSELCPKGHQDQRAGAQNRQRGMACLQPQSQIC